MTQQTIRLIHEDGTEDVVEVDQALWDKFAARAEDLGVPVEQHFLKVLADFVRRETVLVPAGR